MAKKRILASILASLGAFTSSMASKGNINSVKPTINTSISNNLNDRYWERQRIRGRYRNRNRNVPKKPKKDVFESIKFDDPSILIPTVLAGNAAFTVPTELLVMRHISYSYINGITFKNTKDENSKSNGIYRLNIKNRDFFVAFGKAKSPEGNNLIAVFGKDKHEVQQLLKKTNSTKTPKKINLSKIGNTSVLKQVNPQFVDKLKNQLKNKNEVNGCKSDSREKSENSITSGFDFLIKQCIVPEIVSYTSARSRILWPPVLEKLDSKLSDGILKNLPDDIKYFDFDISYAKEEKIKHNIGANIFSVPNNSRY